MISGKSLHKNIKKVLAPAERFLTLVEKILAPAEKLLVCTKKNKYSMILAGFLLTITIFIHFIQLHSLDPDLGWHIRMGQYILDFGFPDKDPFSYTMPDFKPISHSWGSDITLWLIYTAFGYEGLSLVTAIIVMLTLAVSVPRWGSRSELSSCTALPSHTTFPSYTALPSRAELPSRIALPSLLLASGALLTFVGVRPQALTWLLTAIVLKIITREDLWQKYKKYTPLLIIVWVNVHAGFALGIFLFLLRIAHDTIKNRRIQTTDVLLTIGVCTASLVNPYIFDIWKEVLLSFFDPLSRKVIGEWLPVVFVPTTLYVPIFSTALAFIIKFRKNYTPLEKFLFYFFLLVGLSSSKMLPYWIIIAVPIITKGLCILENIISKDRIAVQRYNIFFHILLILCAVFLVFQIRGTYRNIRQLDEETSYPIGALSYLRQHVPEDNIFNTYVWGGYMILNYPEKKVFIDGRMAYWHNSDAPADQSKRALEEYMSIFSKKTSFEHIAEKYGIDTVLITNDTSPESTIFKKKLGKTGWKKVYEDKASLIYSKPLEK